MPLQMIENEYWQIGILPETGSSTAFGRVRRGESWLDVMRPTAASDYGNSSNCASFIMLPWRIAFERDSFASTASIISLN